MSQPIKLTASRYELAFQKALSDLPEWKRKAVKEDMENKVADSRLLSEFSKRVIELAENNEEIFLTC